MSETEDSNKEKPTLMTAEDSWHTHLYRAMLAKHEAEIVGHLYRAVQSVPDDTDYAIKKCYYDFALEMLHRRKKKETFPGLGLNIDFVVRHTFLNKLVDQAGSTREIKTYISPFTGKST